MDIRQLKSFIAVAEEGHIGHAAERLYLSQPALTRQIQLMEEAVGAELFVRTPRGMALTQVGQTFLIDARNTVQMMEQSVDRARRAGRGALGSLDVGIFGTACFDYVPRLLSLLNQRHPEVEVELHYMAAEQLIAGLRQGRLLVVFDRRAVDEPDIASIVAVREPVFLALHEQHPLARQSSIDMASLQHELFIMPRVPDFKLFCDQDFQPKVVREVDNLTVGVVFVASGIGSCIVPRAVVNLRLPGVVYRPLRAKVPPTSNVYCYHLKIERSPLLGVVLEAVRTLDAPGCGSSSDLREISPSSIAG